MFAMVPLIVGGTSQKGLSKVILFCLGFTLILMVFGIISAGLGYAISLPAWFWSIFLGSLYFIMGVVMLKDKLPVHLSGFYVAKRRPIMPKSIINRDLNPFFLGVVFGLAPSPCTIPAVTAIIAFTLVTGNIIFGAIALGAFAIGHSLFLGLTFLPSVRKRVMSNRFLRNSKPALGLILVFLAIYFLIWRPDFVDSNMLTQHNP